MKPFALTSVLKYRQQLEDAAVIKLSEALRVLEEKQNILKKTEEEYQSLLKKYIRYQESGITVTELLRFENRLVWLTHEQSERRRDVDLALEKAEAKRNIVLNKSRDKKVLEQLKARQNTAWRTYLDKKEAAQLDEISVISHQRKKPTA